MTIKMHRREFAGATAGLVVAGTAHLAAVQDQQNESNKTTEQNPGRQPVEAAFERDYPAPKFKPSWKNQQINRLMAQDFVIYAHSDLAMVKKLYERQPALLNASMDWGAGDWETALGGASHMGRQDIARFLLSKGARIDIFCAAMLGKLETIKEMLEMEPTMIDLRGPHAAGDRNPFNLHWHAQVGGDPAKRVLDYLQSVKERKLRPVPWLQKKPKDETKGG